MQDESGKDQEEVKESVPGGRTEGGASMGAGTAPGNAGDEPSGGAQPAPEVTAGSKLPPNVAAGLAAVFPLVGGIIFYVLDKNTPIVRFHSLQSIYFGVAVLVVNILSGILSVVLGVIPILGWMVGGLLWLLITVGTLVLWVMGMVKAFSGERWLMPVVGPMVDKS